MESRVKCCITLTGGCSFSALTCAIPELGLSFNGLWAFGMDEFQLGVGVMELIVPAVRGLNAIALPNMRAPPNPTSFTGRFSAIPSAFTGVVHANCRAECLHAYTDRQRRFRFPDRPDRGNVLVHYKSAEIDGPVRFVSIAMGRREHVLSCAIPGTVVLLAIRTPGITRRACSVQR